VVVLSAPLARAQSDPCGRFKPTTQVAATTTYRERTQLALAALQQVSASLKGGQTQLAEGQLQKTQYAWCELDRAAEYFSNLADTQAKLCDDRATAALKLFNELYQREQKLQETIKETQFALDAIGQTKSPDERVADLQALRTQIANYERELKERQDRLKEFKDWGWTPLYGWGLRIREAINQDSLNAQKLVNELEPLRKQLSEGTADLAEVQEKQARLRDESHTAKQTIKDLGALQGQLSNLIDTHKQNAVFLLDARKFWQRVRLITPTRMNEAEDIEKLQKLLLEEVPDPTLVGMRSKLEVGMEEFATAIDANPNYLFEDSAEYCPVSEPPACKPGYVADGVLCWSACPQDFLEKDKVCVKPDSYVLNAPTCKANFAVEHRLASCLPGDMDCFGPAFDRFITPTCYPQCPSEMPDLGMTCGRVSYSPMLELLAKLQVTGRVRFQQSPPTAEPLVSGMWAGAKGQSRGIRGFSIKFVAPIEGLGLEYKCSGKRWWNPAGMTCTAPGGEALRGFAIRLTGANAANYDAFYSCRLGFKAGYNGNGKKDNSDKLLGDLGLYKNGAFCGDPDPEGRKQVEAMRVWVQPRTP